MAKKTTPVLLIHDGSIDEYMATLLLFRIAGVRIDGIVVVPGNCLAEIGMQTAWKILAFLGRTDVPLLLSSARGFNPFPWPYREDCIKQANVPALRDYPPASAWPPYPNAEEWLQTYFQNLKEKVTVLCLCPLTPVATLLEQYPGAHEGIERLIWMGGALEVAGNLDPGTLPYSVANPYAEWNSFWDPEAVKYVFEHSSFPLLLFPLDITNTARITDAFLNRLLEQGKFYRQADLAYQSYRQTSGAYYCMWDVATTLFLDTPDLYAEPLHCKLQVITSGYKAGALIQSVSGRPVLVYTRFSQLDGFYDRVVKLFSHT